MLLKHYSGALPSDIFGLQELYDFKTGRIIGHLRRGITYLQFKLLMQAIEKEVDMQNKATKKGGNRFVGDDKSLEGGLKDLLNMPGMQKIRKRRNIKKSK